MQIVLELTKIVPAQTMGPDQTSGERKYCIPLDLIGPMEEDEKNQTLLTLRGGQGCVIIKESIDEIKERINMLMAAQAVASQAMAAKMQE